MYYIEVLDRYGNGAIYPDLNVETPYVIVNLHAPASLSELVRPGPVGVRQRRNRRPKKKEHVSGGLWEDKNEGMIDAETV